MNSTHNTTTTTRGQQHQKDVRIQHEAVVTALAWMPHYNGWPSGRRYIASADAGGMVHVSDASQGTVYSHLVHPDAVSALAWSPDTTTLAASCRNGSVQVWNTQTWGRVGCYRGHTSRGKPSVVRGVSYTRDGRYIASCGDDQTVRIWDAFTGETMLTYYRGHHSAITTVAWSPDGMHIASGDAGGVVQVWDAVTGQTLLTYREHEARVTALVWSANGYSILTAAQDGTVQKWAAHSGERLLTYRGLPRPAGSACCKWRGIALSPGGLRIASAGEKQPVQIWDAQTGQLLATCGDNSASALASSVAWSSDGRSLAMSDGGKGVRIW
jgi:WD40 repeat protein